MVSAFLPLYFLVAGVTCLGECQFSVLELNASHSSALKEVIEVTALGKDPAVPF